MVIFSENLTMSTENEATQKGSKITYTRDFLLAFTELDICKDLPIGVGLSNLGQSKISYTREFLLSFSELGVCKRLPSGFKFDLSIQREFGGASSSIFDMQKTPGGKQDIHSSRLNNRDIRSQGNLGSDNGTGYGGHSQYFRQNPGDDGLLGSAMSPKVFCCTDGTLASKVQANGHYQLSKSDNPYLPPHSYKAVRKAGRETDSYTKEESSSAECVDKERAEEERPGGASFELTREKEQKSVQEKQRGDKNDIILFQDSQNDKKLVNNSEECVFSLDDNSAKSSILSLNSACRPLVTTGFTDRNLGVKSLTHHCTFEHHDVEADKNLKPMLHSSKSAHWFLEEENKPAGGYSSLSTKCISEGYRRFNGLITGHNPATFSSQGVLTCEELEKSISSNNDKITATQHHSASGQGVHDTGNEQQNSEYDDGASLCFSSLLQKGVTSCKHKMSSLRKKNSVEGSDNSVPHILIEGISKSSEKGQTIEPNFGIGFMKDFESDEVSLPDQRGSIDRVSGTVIPKPGGFPFSVDNSFTSIADEYPSIGINFEGTRVANFAEITELGNTDMNQSAFDDDWDEIMSMLRVEQELELSARAGRDQMSDSTVQIPLLDEGSLIAIDDTLIPQQPKFMPEIALNLQTEQESKLSPVACCDESAFEFCLPDEESLIAFDDLIIPQHSVSTSGGNSIKDNMLPSNVTVDIPDKLPAQNTVHWDERSNVPGYYSVISLGNSHHNQHSQQSYSQFFHTQINSGRPSFRTFDSHQAQMKTQTKFMHPKATCHTPPLKHYFNAQSCPSGRTAKPKRPGPPVCYSLLQQPIVFPPHQQNELLRGPALPNYMTQLTSHAQGLNPMQIFPSNYQQPGYEGFRMPYPDPGGGVGYNNSLGRIGSKAGAVFCHSWPCSRDLQ